MIGSNLQIVNEEEYKKGLASVVKMENYIGDVEKECSWMDVHVLHLSEHHQLIACGCLRRTNLKRFEVDKEIYQKVLKGT